MTRLREKFVKEVVPLMKEKFGYGNDLEVPKLEKVVVNTGFNKDVSGDKKFLEIIENNLKRITGQKPVRTKSKKAISAFKIREGMVVGMAITLRGDRMYDFVDKIINVVLPRFRDFRGLEKKSVDARGNLTIGVREQIVFPEISPDEVEKVHGMEIVINTSAGSHEEGFGLLKGLGFPFKK